MIVHVIFNDVTAQELNLKKLALFSSCNPFLSWPALKAKDTDNYSRGIVVLKAVLIELKHYFRLFFPSNVCFPCQQRSLFPGIQQARGKERSVSREMCLGFWNNSKLLWHCMLFNGSTKMMNLSFFHFIGDRKPDRPVPSLVHRWGKAFLRHCF